METANIEKIFKCNLNNLMCEASKLRDDGHGKVISYSKKIFIPLTFLCRNFCHYCTFAKAPKKLKLAYLTPHQVLDIAKSGEKAGCYEVLFTLGDKPELRYIEARDELKKYGYKTTVEYLAAMCQMVVKETGMLPHVNPGVLTVGELSLLRQYSVSQGLMLETISSRLCNKGMVHYGSPDKNLKKRIQCIYDAGKLKIPFTTGILIGIGETRLERIESLLKLKELHEQFGHIQEIIIQNFRAKKDTKMRYAPEPSLEELLWTIAVARIIFGPEMNIQTPPNLNKGRLNLLIKAGINDWGGVSPVSIDYVNPEAAWPYLEFLEKETNVANKHLLVRLPVYPKFIFTINKWVDKSLISKILSSIDGMGYVRPEQWCVGSSLINPKLYEYAISYRIDSDIKRIVKKCTTGKEASLQEIAKLFTARQEDFKFICGEADNLRHLVCNDQITYVINRNINYTNICYFNCKFCAFSKNKSKVHGKDGAYNLALDEIVQRADEAWKAGATEVCLQGGIHPSYTGATYIDICNAIHNHLPNLHIHAFSPLEIYQGARTLNISIEDFLRKLIERGLKSLPGTAAEILDDRVRHILCSDKINTKEWIDVISSAHYLGLNTTATIMFGHIDTYNDWATHLLIIKNLQKRSQGFTEFVPLPFVHMDSPLFMRKASRRGPSLREVILMHAISRLVLYPYISNIQVSWVKLGKIATQLCLNAGANDVGGTLMNESISRAAGANNGQSMDINRMHQLILEIGRKPIQRTTLYRKVAAFV